MVSKFETEQIWSRNVKPTMALKFETKYGFEIGDQLWSRNLRQHLVSKLETKHGLEALKAKTLNDVLFTCLDFRLDNQVMLLTMYPIAMCQNRAI